MKFIAMLGYKRAKKVGDETDIQFWKDRIRFWDQYERNFAVKLDTTKK